MAPDEAALLERWTRRRDAEAFNELFRRFADPVYGTCRRILRNDADAEEVAQECFLALVRSGGDVRTSLGGWLHRVATTKSLDRIRRDASRRDREQAAAFPHAVESTWDDIQEHVDAAIETLPDETREMVVAHFLEGRTHQDIATRAGLTRRAVSYRIQGGLEAVRSELLRRGVTVSAVTLGPMLAQGGYAAPASLQVALGKLAIAAGPGVSGGWLMAIGSAVAMKLNVSIGIGVACLVALLLAFFMWYPAHPVTPEPPVRTVNDRAESIPDAAPAVPVRQDGPPQESAPAATDAPGEPNLEELIQRGRVATGQVPTAYPLIDDGDDRASIAGTVIDQDGFPVPGVSVSVVPSMLVEAAQATGMLVLTAQTGSDGTYVVSNIRWQGDFTVFAAKAGCVAIPRGNTPRDEPLAIEAGRHLTEVDFLMKPGVTLAGRILTESGQPVPAATLRAKMIVRPTSMSGLASWAAIDGLTDAAGRFTVGFPAVEAGNLVTLVLSSSFGSKGFPGIVIQDREPVELVVTEPSVIYGVVQDATDNAIGGAYLSFHGQKNVDTPWSGEGTTAGYPMDGAAFHVSADEAGRFALEVDAGFGYTVGVALPSGVQVDDLDSIEALKPGEAREYNPVVAAQSMTVRGRLIGVASGQPLDTYVPMAYVMAKRDGEEVDRLTSIGRDGFEWVLSGEAGRYTFQAGYSNMSDAVGEETAPTELLTGGNIDVDVPFPEPQAFQVRAVGPDGVPIEVATAKFMAAGGGGYVPREITNAEGHWDAPLLIPPDSGTRVQLLKTGYATSWGTVFEDQSPGTVHPEETIVLYPAAGFEGDVVDVAGRPLVNTPLDVTATNAAGQTWPLTATTDDRGHFTLIDEAPADVVDVTISAGDSGTWSGSGVVLVERTITGLGTVRLE